MGNGFVADPEILRAAGRRAHQVTDALRAFGRHSIAVASADVGHGDLARAIDAFTAQWQTSVVGFIEEGDTTGDELINSAVEYEEVDQAHANAFEVILAGQDD